MTVDILTSDSLPHPDILPLYSYPKLFQFDRPFFWTLRDDLYRFSIAADDLVQATSLDGGAEGGPTIFRPTPLALVVRAVPMRLCHLYFLRDQPVPSHLSPSPYVVACNTSGSAHVLLIGRRDDPADPQPGDSLGLGPEHSGPLGAPIPSALGEQCLGTLPQMIGDARRATRVQVEMHAELAERRHLGTRLGIPHAMTEPQRRVPQMGNAAFHVQQVTGLGEVVQRELKLKGGQPDPGLG